MAAGGFGCAAGVTADAPHALRASPRSRCFLLKMRSSEMPLCWYWFGSCAGELREEPVQGLGEVVFFFG